MTNNLVSIIKRALFTGIAASAIALAGCTIYIEPPTPPAPIADFGPYQYSGIIQNLPLSSSGFGLSANRTPGGTIEMFLTQAGVGTAERYEDLGDGVALYRGPAFQFPQLPEGVELGEARSDYNKDGLADFLRLDPLSKNIVLWRNLGNGSYTPYDSQGQLQVAAYLGDIVPYSPLALAVDDWNKDGVDEFAILCFPQLTTAGIIPVPNQANLSVFVSGAWRNILTLERPQGFSSIGIAAVDYDRDGDVDLLVKYPDEPYARVFTNVDNY